MAEFGVSCLQRSQSLSKSTFKMLLVLHFELVPVVSGLTWAGYVFRVILIWPKSGDVWRIWCHSEQQGRRDRGVEAAQLSLAPPPSNFRFSPLSLYLKHLVCFNWGFFCITLTGMHVCTNGTRLNRSKCKCFWSCYFSEHVFLTVQHHLHFPLAWYFSHCHWG